MIRQIINNGRYNFISKELEKNLLSYKYRGQDDSIFYKYLLNPVAELSMKYTPLWIAPNVLTFLGFICILIPQLILFYQFPTATEPESTCQWVCLLTAILHLIYQNLDNMDGKQARRTQNSSPLGMLLDHQVDSMVVFLQTINMCILFKFQMPYGTILAMVISTVPFYFSTLEEYYTGELYLPLVNGANEGSVGIALFFLLSGLFGDSIFFHTVTLYGQTYKITDLLVYFFSFFVLFAIQTNLRNIGFRNLKNAVKKSAVYLYMIVSLFIVTLFSPSQIFQTKLRFVYYIFGFNFSKLVGCIQIAHLTESEFMSMRKSIMYTFTILNANTLYSYYYRPLLNEEYLLYSLAFYSLTCYLQFIVNIMLQISEILNIKIWFINYKHEQMVRKIK